MMLKEIISSKRGTCLRKNGSIELKISINHAVYKDIFVINGQKLITTDLSSSVLSIKPNDYYMLINNGIETIEVNYSLDISKHKILYDPYKFEKLQKKTYTPEYFQKLYKIPEDYIDILPKWYSFKFSYKEYNIIFIKPQLGISLQTHKYRNESWEIIAGRPIIINGNAVYYFVENNTKFEIPKNTIHSVINPNVDKFVILKEQWSGYFDEEDIKRLFNPNNYT
ncbi:MAG: hypothetical protein ACFFDK_06090 [Promethearchaeota archaeon]